MNRIIVSTGLSKNDIKISDGRKHFWQWDTGCQITVMGFPDATELHYFRQGMSEPIPRKVYQRGNERVCDVPDEILQEALNFKVYVNVQEEDGIHTAIEKEYIVKQKPKPTNYIYTETERYTVEQYVDDALNEAKESGDFKGDKGDKGDPGKPGKDGYAPEKGKDYFTEADKQELVNDVLNELPNGDEVSY